MFQYGYNTLFWYFPTEYTDYLNPNDSDIENQIKFWFVVYLCAWLWDSGNL